MKGLKERVPSLLALCLALLCLWQMAQLDETQARLREEIQLKYEYSAVIDSLLGEKEVFLSTHHR